MQQKLLKKMLEMGVSDVGFCRVTDGPAGLDNAMSIVVKLSDAILYEMEDRPTHTYFNHYRTVNAFIDQCLLQAGLELEKHGYRYITVAASQSINDAGWHYRGRYPHKTIARLAGLGTVGKSALFLHHEYGARVRLGTIFTDAPFTQPALAETDPCAGCTVCQKVCPAGAISGKAWQPGMEREAYFDAVKCSAHMKSAYKMIGRGAVCGLCVKYCPYAKRRGEASSCNR